MERAAERVRQVGEQEPISSLLDELQIPDDKKVVSQILDITSSPLSPGCDTRKQSSFVSGKPVQDTCEIPLSNLYPQVEKSVAQVLTPTNGTVLFGSAFKACEPNRKEKCYFVSNAHVVGDSELAGIAAEDGTSVEYARVLAKDTFKDLVLIEIPNGDKRVPVKTGQAPHLDESVFTVGHPYGYPHQVISAGKVTHEDVAFKKEYPAGSGKMEIVDGLWSSSDQVVQGNSGGPTFNKNGEVVGVKTIALNQGGSVNIKVAEVIDLMKRYDDYQKQQTP